MLLNSFKSLQESRTRPNSSRPCSNTVVAAERRAAHPPARASLIPAPSSSACQLALLQSRWRWGREECEQKRLRCLSRGWRSPARGWAKQSPPFAFPEEPGDELRGESGPWRALSKSRSLSTFPGRYPGRFSSGGADFGVLFQRLAGRLGNGRGGGEPNASIFFSREVQSPGKRLKGPCGSLFACFLVVWES